MKVFFPVVESVYSLTTRLQQIGCIGLIFLFLLKNTLFPSLTYTPALFVHGILFITLILLLYVDLLDFTHALAISLDKHLIAI